MTQFKRIFLIVVDSFGIGAMPNAKEYDDEGADTFGHIDQVMNPFHIDTMMKLGLGQLHPTIHAKINPKPMGYFGKMFEASVGKDTITGHWEMMGIYLDKPFITFTETGFPAQLIQELEKQTGHEILGNKAASGTEILKELAPQETISHSKKMIVYTSADSVLQICGNEETMGLDELYRCCQIARNLTMRPEWKVGRVIARPYIIRNGQYIRTSNRKDYALKPPFKTCLDVLKENKLDVISIGKISDIFNGQGISKSLHSESSIHGMQQMIELSNKDFTGLCFCNLVDFDAKWGHRRNPIGYGKELESFDKNLKALIKQLSQNDLLIITADHGNDPTHKGSDHTKEVVPLMIYSKRFKESKRLENQNNFATVGATILDNFGLSKPDNAIGTSILSQLL